MKRILGLVVMVVLVASFSLSAFAESIDIGILSPEEETVATWVPSAAPKKMTRAAENIYAGKGFSYYNGVPLGSYGWTNATNSSNGTYKYHYTTAECYDSNFTWRSSRIWGSGQVYAYTGKVALWAITEL